MAATSVPIWSWSEAGLVGCGGVVLCCGGDWRGSGRSSEGVESESAGGWMAASVDAGATGGERLVVWFVGPAGLGGEMGRSVTRRGRVHWPSSVAGDGGDDARGESVEAHGPSSFGSGSGAVAGVVVGCEENDAGGGAGGANGVVVAGGGACGGLVVAANGRRTGAGVGGLAAVVGAARVGDSVAAVGAVGMRGGGGVAGLAGPGGVGGRVVGGVVAAGVEGRGEVGVVTGGGEVGVGALGVEGRGEVGVAAGVEGRGEVGVVAAGVGGRGGVGGAAAVVACGGDEVGDGM